MITLEQGVEMVWHAFEDMLGGEIYVKKIPSMKITDLAKAVDAEARQDIIGIRPGEKVHEQMISNSESTYTYDYETYYKIVPRLEDWSTNVDRIKGGSKVPEGFSYSSDLNEDWMSIETLRKWIEKNRTKIGAL
jgi:FlaA1/EpsC-like NDP-sugar epimerase